MEDKKKNRTADWLDSLDDSAPTELSDKQRKRFKKQNYKAPGYKYYLSVHPYLPDWWNEWNGDLEKGRTKWRTLEKFVHYKTKNKQERTFLMFMLGPKPEHGAEKQNQTPWLGDWYKRRKNGYWVEDNSKYLRYLAKSIREMENNGEAVKAAAPFLVKSIMRLERLADKVDEAFGGQPFLDEDPAKTGSGKRFRVYAGMHEMIYKQKERVIYAWMRLHGIDPHKPNEMWNMAQIAKLTGQIGAGAALSGAVAGLGFQPQGINQDGSLQLGQGISINKDAMLVAAHLTRHAETFRKPLPEPLTVEFKDVTEEKPKTNGKHVTQ